MVNDICPLSRVRLLKTSQAIRSLFKEKTAPFSSVALTKFINKRRCARRIVKVNSRLYTARIRNSAFLAWPNGLVDVKSLISSRFVH
jgi:hypothetical protein